MTEQQQQSSYAPPPPPHQVVRENGGRVYSIIGAVCGVLALLFFPIVLGPAGIALGFVGNAKGDKPLGLIVGIGSIVTMVLGFVLGAAIALQAQG